MGASRVRCWWGSISSTNTASEAGGKQRVSSLAGEGFGERYERASQDASARRITLNFPPLPNQREAT